VPGEIADEEEASQIGKTEKKPKMKGDHSKKDKKHSEALAQMTRCAEFIKNNVIHEEEAGDDEASLKQSNNDILANGDANKRQEQSSRNNTHQERCNK